MMTLQLSEQAERQTRRKLRINTQKRANAAKTNKNGRPVQDRLTAKHICIGGETCFQLHTCLQLQIMRQRKHITALTERKTTNQLHATKQANTPPTQTLSNHHHSNQPETHAHNTCLSLANINTVHKASRDEEGAEKDRHVCKTKRMQEKKDERSRKHDMSVQ